MMFRARNFWWHRSLAALLAVWFSVVTSEIASVDGCRMHNMPTAPAAGTQVDMAMSHHMTMPEDAPGKSDATYYVQHARATSPDTHGDSHDAQHQCVCIGTCCAVTTQIPTEINTGVLTTTSLFMTPAVVGVRSIVAVQWAGFILPFATAPPAVLS